MIASHNLRPFATCVNLLVRLARAALEMVWKKKVETIIIIRTKLKKKSSNLDLLMWRHLSCADETVISCGTALAVTQIRIYSKADASREQFIFR